MAYQFIHVDSYSVKAKANKGKKATDRAMSWSAADILDEATRKEGACHHVDTPKPPKWEVGSRQEVEKSISSWMSEKSATGRTRRQDTPVLLAGVISLEVDLIDKWPEYKRDCIDYLREKYGENLKGVVEHLDESHPHIHFYAVPKPDQEFTDIHEGKKAYYEALKKKENFITAEAKAMSAFQDEFNQKVASRHGLSRLGPKRERMTRKGWKAQKEFLLMKADVENEVRESAKEEIKRKKQEILQAATAKGQEILQQALKIRKEGIPPEVLKAIEKCQEAQNRAAKLIEDGKLKEAEEHLARNKEFCDQVKEIDNKLNNREDSNSWKRKIPPS